MSGRDVKIRNVGPKSAAWLRQVGVRTTEDLFRVGPVDAFLKVKRAGISAELESALFDGRCHRRLPLDRSFRRAQAGV